MGRWLTGHHLRVMVVIAAWVGVLGAPQLVAGATDTWEGYGPLGGDIYDLTVDPGDHRTVWAAASLGLVFRSTDRGQTWSRRSTGIKAGTVIGSAIAAPSDPATVYAAGNDPEGQGVVYRSTDSGATWTLRDTGLEGTSLNAFAVDPNDEDVVFAYVFGSLQKTVDGGGDWDDSGSGLSGTVFDVIIRETDSDKLFAATATGVYRSLDAGDSWTPRSNGLSGVVTSILFDPFDTDRLYAATSGDYVYETTDKGQNWSPLGTGLPDPFVEELAIDPDTGRLYAVVNQEGVWALDTTDPIPVWTEADTGIDEPDRVTAIAVDPVTPQKVYAGLIVRGVARSTDGATSWTASNTGLTATVSESVVLDAGATSTAYTPVPNDDLYRTTDRGDTWHSRSAGLPDGFGLQMAISPSDPQVLYAAGLGPGVYRTADGGATWDPTDTAHFVDLITVHPTDPDTAWYVAGSDGIYKTENGGDDWDASNNGLPALGGYPIFEALAVSPSDPDVLYAGTYQEVYTSVNGGDDWTEVSSGLEATHVINSLAIHPTDPDKVYAGLHNDLGVYRTTNGGTSWSARGLSGKTVRAVIVDPADPAILYAGTEGNGVRRSLDRGATWSSFNTGLTFKWVTSLAISPDAVKLYAATPGGGVYSYKFP